MTIEEMKERKRSLGYTYQDIASCPVFRWEQCRRYSEM